MTELTFFENYATRDFDVYFQDEATLNTTADLQYVKYGQDEIDDYIASVSKPELTAYVEDQKQVINIETNQSITEISQATQAGIDDINETIAEYSQNYVTTDTIQTISGDKTFECTLQATTPSPDDLSPCVATTAFVNGGNVISKGNNHIKYASGLIMQWGTAVLSGNTGTECTYEIPFASNSYSVTLTHITNSISSTAFSTASVISHSTTAFSLNSNNTGSWFWFAIGF